MRIDIQVSHEQQTRSLSIDVDDYPNRALFYVALDALFKSVDLTMLRFFGVRK